MATVKKLDGNILRRRAKQWPRRNWPRHFSAATSYGGRVGNGRGTFLPPPLLRPLFSRRRKIIIPRNMLHVTYGVKYGHRMTWRKIWPPVTRIIRCKIYDPSITRTIRCKYIASLLHVQYGVKSITREL